MTEKKPPCQVIYLTTRTSRSGKRIVAKEQVCDGPKKRGRKPKPRPVPPAEPVKQRRKTPLNWTSHTLKSTRADGEYAERGKLTVSVVDLAVGEFNRPLDPPRIAERGGTYWLDGRPVGLDELMRRANRIRKARGDAQLGRNPNWLV